MFGKPGWGWEMPAHRVSKVFASQGLRIGEHCPWTVSPFRRRSHPKPRPPPRPSRAMPPNARPKTSLGACLFILATTSRRTCPISFISLPPSCEDARVSVTSRLPSSLFNVVTCSLLGTMWSPCVIRGPPPDFLPREHYEFFSVLTQEFISWSLLPPYSFRRKRLSTEHALSPFCFFHFPPIVCNCPKPLLPLLLSVILGLPCPNCKRLPLISRRVAGEMNIWLRGKC